MASQSYGKQKPVQIEVTNEMVRLMNYYRTKFESKVDAMVQSSMASTSQQVGQPLASQGTDGYEHGAFPPDAAYTFHDENFDMMKGSAEVNDELDNSHANYSKARKKKDR